MNLTGEQKRTIVAAWLGWTLDAFDFFLLTFLLKDIAKEFGVEVSAVAYALFLTLAMRFVGAFIFGRIGDKWGRKPALMLDILCYSIIGALAAFSPNLWVFLVLRALFGVAMGGEWGLGSSLAMESIPPQARGTVSGFLQCGYPSGFLLAAIVYGLIYGHTFGDYTVGWRAMFLLSVLPAFVVLFIRSSVPESPAFEASQAHEKPPLWATVAEHKGLVLYMVLLMLCFNLFSHGTQDLYPTFLQKQHNFDPRDGELDHHRRQSRRDRRRPRFRPLVGEDRPGERDHYRVPDCAAGDTLMGFRTTPVLLALGAFVMQIAVQGAWGVIPAHLNELAPGAARATIPAFVYQAGNFLASYNGPFQARSPRRTAATTASRWRWSAGVVAVAIVVVIRFSPERRGHVLMAH